MTKPSKDSLVKDYKHFINFRLSILIIVLIVTIVAIVYWIILTRKKRKAKPIINNYSETPGGGLKGPLLTFNETDESQSGTGYALAGVNEPCDFQAENSGLPNLPNSFKVQGCKSGYTCIPGVREGKVCKADIGSPCQVRTDCAPPANGSAYSVNCINNICSADNDTLNQSCISDFDCKQLPSRYRNNYIYNHVCQKNAGQNKGLCKVNYYPFDTGCQSDTMCVGENSKCITGKKGAFDISIDSGGSFVFTNTNINWGDINGSVATINSAYYLINNWDIVNKKGTLTPTLTSGNNLTIGKKYKISLGNEQEGICIVEIPEGGPANLELGGVSIPCEEGLKNISNFCLSEENPRIGQVCINSTERNLICREDVTRYSSDRNNSITAKPACLYDDATEQAILTNYNYGIDSEAFEIYKIGKCAVENAEKGDVCDSTFAGCIPPFVCLKEINQNGDPVSFCNTPYQAQICTNEQCPDGRECAGENKEGIPICKSKKGFMGLIDSDCISKSLGSNALQIFDPDTGKLYKDAKKISIGTANIRLSSPGLCNQIYPGTSSLALPNPILFWLEDGAPNTIFMRRLKDTKNEFMHVYLPENHKVKDVVIDEDENIILLYKIPVTDTMRERIMPIQNVIDSKYIVLPENNGIVSGTSVFYLNTRGLFDPLVNSREIYQMTTVNGTSFSLFRQNGQEVSISRDSSPSIDYIITYDNRYSISNNSENTTWLLSPNYSHNTGTIHESQIKNGDELTYTGTGTSFQLSLPTIGSAGKRTISAGISNGFKYYPTVLGTALEGTTGNYNSSTRLFTSDISPSKSLSYALGDEYYHSVGGYPIIENKKVFHQKIIGADNSNYFTLNGTSFYTYGVTVIPFEDKAICNVTSPTYILNDAASLNTINGINRGITYLYNDNNDDIKISTKKLNNQNYLILNKGIEYALDNGTSTKYVNHLLEYKYDITLNEGSLADNTFNENFQYSNQYIANNKLTSDNNDIKYHQAIFYFTLDKTVAQDISKGFYYSNIEKMENNIDNVTLNKDNSLFYTLTHNEALNNNVENTVAINSKYEKVDISDDNYTPAIEYNKFNNFEDVKPLPFSNITELGTSAYKNGDNYYIINNSYIYIHNQQDIDNILNFSSSDLVLTKQGILKGTPAGANYKRYTQATLNLINIEEYNVTLDSEYMKIKVHVPISDDKQYQEVLNDNSSWELHCYNFVPLNYFNLGYGKNDGDYWHTDSYVYFISDASMLFYSTKGVSFFNNNKEADNSSRTSYNKILCRNTGKNTSDDGNTHPSSSENTYYSVYTITDGAGVGVNGTGTEYTAIEETYSDPASFYDIKIGAFYSSNNTSNIDNNLTCLPDSIPCQYFSLQGLPYASSYTVTDDGSISYSNQYTNPGSGSRNLSSFNNFSTGRFFPSFIPMSNEQINIILNIYWRYFLLNYPPATIQQTSGTENTSTYDKNDTTIAREQFVSDSNQSDVNNSIRQMYTGCIRLPYPNYSDKLYTINNLFASSLSPDNRFFINSSPIVHDNIVVSSYKDKEGNIKLMKLGNISLYQNALAHYQTGTEKNPDYFNKTNQIAISWPTWFKTRYNNDRDIPIIKKVIIDYDKNNTYGNTTYYAFIEINGKTSLVYLNNDNTNSNISNVQGVATTESIYEGTNKGTNKDILNQGFAMTAPSRFLYMLTPICSQ